MRQDSVFPVLHDASAVTHKMGAATGDKQTHSQLLRIKTEETVIIVTKSHSLCNIIWGERC